MGKKQFLRELNRKLRTLEKSERRRYLDDYEEMIADMVEGGLTEEEAVSRLGSPEKIGETLLENTKPESRRRIDVPGTLLAALSLVLTVVSVWRYLTIRSIFGTFAGLSEQSVSVIGGADGPTSIFVAGKVSQPLGLYAVTACLILVTVFYFVKKYRK